MAEGQFPLFSSPAQELRSVRVPAGHFRDQGSRSGLGPARSFSPRDGCRPPSLYCLSQWSVSPSLFFEIPILALSGVRALRPRGSSPGHLGCTEMYRILPRKRDTHRKYELAETVEYLLLYRVVDPGTYEVSGLAKLVKEHPDSRGVGRYAGMA